MSGTLYSYNKQQFNSDVSFNSNTQITTTGLIGLSGGTVNISGGVINLSSYTYPVLYASGDTKVTSRAGYSTFLNNDKTSGHLYINTTSPTSNVIVENGNVGIGTGSPGAKLDVSGNIVIRNGKLSVNDGKLDLHNGDGYHYIQYQTDGVYQDGPKIAGYAGGALGSSSTGNFVPALTWWAGNVGIGNTSPNTKLEINAELSNTPFSNPWNSNWGLSITNNTANNNLGNGIAYRPALAMGITGGGSGAAGAAKAAAYIASLAPFGTAGWNDLYLDGNNICLGVNNGSVGIGTANPRNKLDVYGNIYSKNLILQGDGTNGYVYTTNSGSNLYLGSNNTSQMSIQSNGNLNLINSTFNNPKFFVSNAGADDSAFVLQAGYSGGTYSSIGIYSDWNGTGGNNGKIQFNTKGAQRMVINYDGNVGIGTANPGRKLHVEGDTFSKNFYSNAGGARSMNISDGILYSYYTNYYGQIYQYENEMTYVSYGDIGRYSCHKFWSGDFTTDNSVRCNVQIGSTYPLQVFNSYSLTNFGGVAYMNNYIAHSTSYHSDIIGINVDTGAVRARGFYAYSDKRIKTNIVDIDDAKALSILRQIQPKTYDYVDKIQRGNENVIGFIAQEIKEILPKAVTIVKDYAPTFYTVCQVAPTDASNILLVTSPIDLSWNALHDPSGNAFVDAEGNACSDAAGNKVFNVKLYDQSNNNFECKTTSILDKRSFLMDVSGSKMVDASGNLQLVSDGKYFLHGQEVDDFHNIDKSAIFTVVTAAVQDIDRKQQAHEAQIQSQEAKIAALESKNAALEAQVASLQSQMAAVLSKLAM